MPKVNCCLRFLSITVRYILAPLGLPILVFVAPFYRMYDGWVFNWFQQRHVSTPAEHRKKVARVQDQVRNWHAGGRKTRMVTGRPAWTSLSVHGINKRNMACIEIGDLTCVVEVDEQKRVVTVEPGIMMGQLSTILTKRGWTIPVIPEFETLTVGGLACGTGIESSSGRYGFFGDTPIEYEMVLSNGDVMNCSKDENSDLFHAIPWSHGTLGFLTAVKFPLLSAKKYVEVEYHATDSVQEAQRLLERVDDYEFVEGIAYGRNKFVVTLGNMSDRPDPHRGPVNHINRWYKPYWYKHVESFLSRRHRKNGKPQVEYIPLRDYYHRHTRPYFWVLPLVVPFINIALFRMLFGWILPRNQKFFRRVTRMLGVEQMMMDAMCANAVLQDFVIPLKHLRETIDFVHDKVEIYPLWLCPCTLVQKPGMTHCNDTEREVYFDIGVYGEVAEEKQADYHFLTTGQEIEAFFLEHAGVQLLYADSYLSPEDFRRMFDMILYDQVRAKYQCLDAFPDVYDKVGKYARGIAKV